jgi:hypothetical protein
MSELNSHPPRRPGVFIGKVVFVVGFAVILTILVGIHYFASR